LLSASGRRTAAREGTCPNYTAQTAIAQAGKMLSANKTNGKKEGYAWAWPSGRRRRRETSRKPISVQPLNHKATSGQKGQSEHRYHQGAGRR